jgi:ligand-binding sensor domain-containing protein/signal transduction histidine kinase
MLTASYVARWFRWQRVGRAGFRFSRVLVFSLCLACGAAVTNSATAEQSIVPQVRPEVHILPVSVMDGRDIQFSHLTAAQAPSQTQVSLIIQDDQGFLWFATQQGLNRYDGYKCKVFAHDPEVPDSLGGSFVYSLFKDRSGSIWVGTEQSFDRFDPTMESFTHVHINREDPIVIQITQDISGMLWLSTPKGLYRLDPANQRVVRFAANRSDPYALSSDQIESTGEDGDGNFWVVTVHGFDKFDRNTGRVTLHIPLPESTSESLCSPACRSFHEDRFGVFWIISRSGLAVLDLKANRVTKFTLDERGPRSKGLTGVNAFLENYDGTMWFGTTDQGLLKFDRAHRRFIRYRNYSGDPESLSENHVISLYQDQGKNIWVGFYATIPDFFVGTPIPYQAFRPALGTRANTGENLVNAIYKDREGNLWMGTGGALYRVDGQTERYIRYDLAGVGVSTEVLAIAEDHSGALWIGTEHLGLIRFEPKAGRLKRFRHRPSDPHSLSDNTVARIWVEPNGIMWVSTWDGLDRFDPASETFVTYKSDPKATEPYFSILQDRAGFLWLGAKSGLARFDPSTGQFNFFRHNPQDSRTLSNDTVDSSYQDRSGAIWLGTQDGLNLMNRDETFSSFTTKNGLPGDAVSCILGDDENSLWMSTNKGLSKFNPTTKIFENYNAADGLPGDDLTGWDACFRSPTGEMFFGGFAGAVSFRPAAVSDTYVPPIVLTDFQLANRPPSLGYSSFLDKSISAASYLTLPYRERFFSIQFAALSFRSPATNRYRYKLQGLESNWHEVASNQRSVSYAALPAGVYEFKVQGATSRGAWDEPGVALQIHILPPWWNTWWFRSIWVGTGLCLLWMTYRYRLAQINKQVHIRIEERVNERTRIARELHDTLLQNFHGLMFQFQAASNLMARKPDEAKQSLDDAIIETKKALAESREAIQGLRSESIAKGSLPELLKSTSRELANSNANGHPPVFDLIEEGDRQTLSSTVSDEICRIVLELMRNAYQHAHAQRIEAEIRYGDSMFRLRIRDDGQGIDPTVLKEGGRLGHWGLRGIRERTDRIGGHLDLWSEPGRGTEVQLLVPASIAYESLHDSYRAKLVRKVKSRAQRS